MPFLLPLRDPRLGKDVGASDGADRMVSSAVFLGFLPDQPLIKQSHVKDIGRSGRYWLRRRHCCPRVSRKFGTTLIS